MAQGKKIKVFHVLTDRNIGGAGRWLLNYLRYYDRGRFEVSVVLPADSLLCEAVRELGVPVLAMPEMEDKSYDPKAVRPLTAVFRKEKPDIVHTHASMTARMAAKRAGVPKIFHQNILYEALHGGHAGGIPEKACPAGSQPKVQRYNHRGEQSSAPQYDRGRDKPEADCHCTERH